MQIKPIIENYNPQYPNSNEVKDIGKVLNNKKPKRWLKNAAIAGLMLSMIGISTGCKKIPVNQSNLPAFSLLNKNIRIATPLFEHGSGIGFWGCLSVAPPAFLNESEAVQIIRNELIDSGLFSSNAITNNDSTCQYQLTIKNLNFNILFVSFPFIKKYNNDILGAIRIDFKKAAKQMLIEAYHKGVNCVVFYDILTLNNHRIKFDYYNPDNKELVEKYNITITEEAKDSLRAQVRDFIHWFKNEKVWW